MDPGARSFSETIPGYRSLNLVSDGPVSQVFSAFSERLNGTVLLHLLRAEAAGHPGLQQSARACLGLAHPHLVRHLELEPLAGGRWALVTEALEGESLEAVLRNTGPLEADVVVQLATLLCEGLEYLHRNGRTHGELRPGNVFLCNGLSAFQPKLAGFAYSVRPDGPAGVEYLAPECAAGAPPTASSDLYAFGALLVAALTGKAPFTGASAEEVLRLHREAEPSPLPSSAAHLTEVVHRCLEKDPKRRFASAAGLAMALTRSNQTMVSFPRATDAARTPGASALPARRPEAARDAFGSYQLVRLLGEGSMGQVYLAKHALLGRQVAIKVLRPEQYRHPDLIQRFFQEARTVNQINHEHIVEIFDFVEETGPDGPTSVYCVMELLVGDSLGALLERKQPLPIRRAVQIIRQVCDALAAAHKVGVVHRDIKPDNIFLCERGDTRDYVKVLDFGVAKLTSIGTDAPLISTMDGTIIGTPICMSPEQATGSTVDQRADIYATGVVLYLLLSGRLPFEGKTFAAIAAQIITKAPPPLPDATPGGEKLAPALKALVLRCLEKDPARRPQSMGEIKDALAPFAATAGAAPAAKPAPRRWPLAAAAAILALGAVAGVVLWPRPPVPPALPAPLAVAPPVTPAAPPEVKPPEPVAEKPPPAAPNPVRPRPPIAQRPAGPLTVQEIGAVVSRSKGNILKCFERHRTQLTDPQGQVTITLSIDSSGAVSAAKVSIAEDSPLSACIVKEARALKFPKHTGPAMTINVPFAYRVGG